MRNIITPAVLNTMIPQEFEDWRDGGEDLRRELTHAVMCDLTCPAGWDMNGEYRSELATKKTALPVRDSGTVPDVVGQSVRRAVEMFARQGLVPVIKGNGSRVVRQTPEPGVRWAGKDSAPTSCVLWLSEQE